MFHLYCKVAGNDYGFSKEARQIDAFLRIKYKTKAMFIIDRMKKLN
jgi:hypothetical protein